MKRFGGVLLALVGAGALLFGLLFLVGSAGELHRLAVAAAGLLGGTAALGSGVWLFRQGSAFLPERIQAEILALAKREDGEIAEAEIRALMGERWPRARPVLDRMLAEGLCEERRHEGSRFYLFRDLQARLTIRTCEYCDAELPVAEELASCPSCGGTFTTCVRRVSMADDSYGMD